MSSNSANTAVILVDPYNEFLHPEGKINALIADSLAATNTISHLEKLVTAARKHKIPIFYGLHQQVNESFIFGWKHATPTQISQKEHEVFKEGSWGVEIYKGLEPDPKNGDIVVSKHWSGSSFRNTDLDHHLRQREITNVVIAGLAAETCVESTARYAYELGYNVTLLKNGTAFFARQIQAEHADLVWTRIVQQVSTVEEWIATLES